MFMKPQITEKQIWALVENEGSEHDGGFGWIPNDHVNRGDNVLERMTGYGARLSAPGYMDCTSWSVHKTVAEAAQDLIDNYFDTDSGDEDEEAIFNELTQLANGAK